MKAKLKGAETGHSLLKRKSEALTKCEVLLKMPLAIYKLIVYLLQTFSR